MLKPTVIAIPIFALLIALESWFAIRENRENLTAKILGQIFFSVSAVWCSARFSVWQLPFFTSPHTYRAVSKCR